MFYQFVANRKINYKLSFCRIVCFRIRNTKYKWNREKFVIRFIHIEMSRTTTSWYSYLDIVVSISRIDPASSANFFIYTLCTFSATMRWNHAFTRAILQIFGYLFHRKIWFKGKIKAVACITLPLLKESELGFSLKTSNKQKNVFKEWEYSFEIKAKHRCNLLQFTLPLRSRLWNRKDPER